MLLSQPATPIICGNETYLPIWIPFKSDSLPASSPSFSLAHGPTFQTATTLNSENLRQHFQAPSIQPPPGILSPFPIVPPIDTSVPPPPVVFSQTPSPIHPEVVPHTSIPPQPNVSCQVQIPLETPDIAPTDSKHPLCFTAAAQVFHMPSQFVYDEKALPEPKVITHHYLDLLPKLFPEESCKFLLSTVPSYRHRDLQAEEPLDPSFISGRISPTGICQIQGEFDPLSNMW